MTKIYCSNCGTLISEASNFCFSCGAAQHGRESAAFLAEATPRHDIHNLPQTTSSNRNEKHSAYSYIKKRHLCERAKISFMLGYVGKTSILLPLFILGLFIYPEIFGIAILGYVLILFLSALLAFNNFYYRIDEAGFQKEYGIIHKVHVSIPYHTIQNVNIHRSLTDLLLGLARLSIETAGSSTTSKTDVIGGSTSNAEGHLPGLTLEQAKKIHDLLLLKANDSQ